MPESKTTPLSDADIVRRELKVMEGLASCRGDDDCIREAQEAFERIIHQLSMWEAVHGPR